MNFWEITGLVSVKQPCFAPETLLRRNDACSDEDKEVTVETSEVISAFDAWV